MREDIIPCGLNEAQCVIFPAFVQVMCLCINSIIVTESREFLLPFHKTNGDWTKYIHVHISRQRYTCHLKVEIQYVRM